MEWAKNGWEVVIGLETHTQLKTNTKIFSGASIQYGAEPNTQADEVSTALPGVLPVLNKQAVECAIKFGLAINAEIPSRSVFSRKNYFYPDLPKGYQISQFELPVVGKGAVTIQVPASGKNAAYEKVINITRAHLEEDAGKSMHGAVEGMSGIDLNRAGTPLLEIVTEPDMRSAAEAVAYAKKLHELVQWIGICDGNMQEGSFRCDVNVSVRPKGSDKLGTRREIKNLNSFKFMTQAIEYETHWQIETLEDGGKIQQATVLFNPETGETKSMRSKEEANDYRYFPDPDLLPLVLDDAFVEECRASLPELPDAKRARYENALGLAPYAAGVLTADVETARWFESLVGAAAKAAGKGEADLAKQASNWLISELFGALNKVGKSLEDSPITPTAGAELLALIADGTISGSIAKLVLEKMLETGDSAGVIVEREGLKQQSDTGAIESVVAQVLADNADKVEQYRAGKEALFGFFVGQTMKAMQGKANPQVVNEAVRKGLG